MATAALIAMGVTAILPSIFDLVNAATKADANSAMRRITAKINEFKAKYPSQIDNLLNKINAIPQVAGSPQLTSYIRSMRKEATNKYNTEAQRMKRLEAVESTVSNTNSSLLSDDPITRNIKSLTKNPNVNQERIFTPETIERYVNEGIDTTPQRSFEANSAKPEKQN